MTQMAKVTTLWTGFTGAPGYTNFYFRDFTSSGDVDQAVVDGAVSKTDAFFASIQSRVPPTVKLQVDNTIEVIEDTTGQLVGFFSVASQPTRTGSATGAYSAASGACFNWYTNGVRNGRRIRGRTFIVPLGGSAMSGDGNIDDTQLSGMRTAATGLIASAGAGDFGVWARPTAPGATDGRWDVVTSFTLPDKAAVLRSRRD